ncbi:MAG TPA: addiction module protein [Thermoanaerobaculia bacterium]|nr:addiction module protein [Thermoanaerobaculia bacterium]
MTKAEIREQVLTTLSPEDRVELAIELWESLDPADLAVPAWHLDMVRERLDEHRRDPESARPGEELLAWLRQPRA